MKMRIKRSIRKPLAFILIAVLIMGATPFLSYASSIQKEIDKTQREKGELEDKLDETDSDLKDLKEEHNTLKGAMNSLNQELTAISENLADLENRIEIKTQEIADAQNALEEARITEEWQYECMVRRIRFQYEYDNGDVLDSIFSMTSFSEMLNKADYLEKIAAYDMQQMEEYTANRQYIEEEEARLIIENEELNRLKVETEAEKSRVAGLISKTANSVTKYADQIAETEKDMLAMEAEIEKKGEDLEALKKKLAEEIAKSQQAANASWRDISEISFEEGDRHLLANIIYCEAGGEAYAGQLAVGAVIINRVLSSVYPDTVIGVVYQSGQFSPVASGRLELALSTNRATESCYRAADEAMAGINNIGNCVFFRTPIEGLTGISIGGHIFY
ncbi:cell wall hydrolase [Lachnospiraceae bacterium OttesenSCG-928-D06]|nr:cell wall hydrolase [Lachnospiraceae bacterium OttesenSCG-928-D06]